MEPTKKPFYQDYGLDLTFVALGFLKYFKLQKTVTHIAFSEIRELETDIRESIKKKPDTKKTQILVRLKNIQQSLLRAVHISELVNRDYITNQQVICPECRKVINCGCLD